MSTLTVTNITGLTGGISPVLAEIQASFTQANTSRTQANTARSQANTAFDQANTALALAIALGV